VVALIDAFVSARLDRARSQMVDVSVKRIQPGDVVPTHARSRLALQVRATCRGLDGVLAALQAHPLSYHVAAGSCALSRCLLAASSWGAACAV
jgi:hypothetical protein